MDDITFKGVGIWLLSIIEAIVIFLAFMLGKATNGLPVEVAIFIGSILASSNILIVLIIKRYFKINGTS